MRSSALRRLFRTAERLASPRAATTQPGVSTASGAGTAQSEIPECEAVDLDAADGRARLFARLRAISDVQRAATGRPTLPRSVRIRDVVLTGPRDDEGYLAEGLERDLVREFPEDRLEFRVVSSFEPGEPLRAFFGLGVFAPSPDGVRVADLQFGWRAAPEPGDIVWPRRGPYGGQDRRVAWYAGQRGLAVGFHPKSAPAVLDRSRAPPNSAAIAALEDVVLFFGRRDPHTAPVVRAIVRGSTLRPMDVAVALEHHGDWWLRDGHWQWVRITIVGKGSAVLWFRLIGRTADAQFHTHPTARRHDIGKGSGPRMIVRGLILPEPPPLLQSASAFLRGRSLRWVVEFDSENRLRGSELCELQRSVVADWGVRLAVWRHEPPGSWTGRAQSTDGRQSLELKGGERIEVREFPPSVPKETDREKRRSIRSLYRHEWCLLQFEDDGAFGSIAAFPRAILLDDPVDGTPDAGAAPADGEWRIGLDWLNRAANVSMGDLTTGLAQHWAKSRTTRLEATTQGLLVTVSSRAAPRSYRIGVGELGPVGPLYIEYRVD